jgi:putative nucleotidyltransferase with HDIG domain
VIQTRSASYASITEQLSGKDARGFLSLVRLRDPDTGGHCNRVRLLARKVCEQLGLSPNEVANIVMASCLHDIGKIGMPDAILRKPFPLTAEERAIMNTHPYEGSNILKQIEGFSEIAEIVRHHHEWYDGNGYPDGLRGDQISFGARIVAILDAYDAMISGRCYQRAITKNRVIVELIKGKGRQFDPDITDLVIPILRGRNHQIGLSRQSVRFAAAFSPITD